MRCAIIAVSKEGTKLSNKIKNLMDFDIYVKEKYVEFSPKNSIFYDKISELTAKIFNSYDAIIFVCAVGIVVRTVATHIKNKLTDPAVIVIDEKGKFVISLLSGHIGGANLLSKEIAKFIKGTPVITTATDVNELIAPDLIASILNLNVYPKSEILNINNSLLNGNKIEYFIDKNLIHAEFYKNVLEKYNIDSKIVDMLDFDKNKPIVFITNKIGNEKDILYLIPQKLIAGIGCKKGTSKELILSALTDATKKIGRDLSFINLIASSIVKQNERGILEAVDELKTKVKFFSNEKLQEKIDEYFLQESEFVKQNIGVGNVSEAAALAAVKIGKFALNKTKYEKVTVALVWEELQWLE